MPAERLDDRGTVAGFIIVCSRDAAALPWNGADLRRCAVHLGPDDITPNPPDVREEAGLARAVINPVPGVRITPGGVCLGALFEDADWSSVGTSIPDGTFAIVRHDWTPSRLLTGTFGSRTVWYVHTESSVPGVDVPTRSGGPSRPLRPRARDGEVDGGSGQSRAGLRLGRAPSSVTGPHGCASTAGLDALDRH